jgi:hypothetical protein
MIPSCQRRELLINLATPLELGFMMVFEAASAGEICTIAETSVDQTRQLTSPDVHIVVMLV